MKLEVQFIKSATKPDEFPLDSRPEVAILGRSNAGKSSFINAMVGRQIAKVSQSPGKTRLLNFFDIGEHYRLVDMPGYGFSKRSGDEQRSWQAIIENYLSLRGSLVGLLLIIDCRRKWTADEEMLVSFCKRIGKPILIVLTKADQVLPREREDIRLQFQDVVRKTKVLICSASEKFGISEVEECFFTDWIKPIVKLPKKGKV